MSAFLLYVCPFAMGTSEIWMSIRTYLQISLVPIAFYNPTLSGIHF